MWGVYENKREDERLPSKSIKELKAENKELAELKIVCLLKLKKQSEEIKRLKRENERTGELISACKKWLKLACLKKQRKAI